MIDNCQLDKTAFDSRVYRTEYLLLAVPAALDVNRGSRPVPDSS